eukprot:gene4013-5016_t
MPSQVKVNKRKLNDQQSEDEIKSSKESLLKKQKKEVVSDSSDDSSSDSDSSSSESENESTKKKVVSAPVSQKSNNNKQQQQQPQQQQKQSIPSMTQVIAKNEDTMVKLSTFEWRKQHNVKVEGGDKEYEPFQTFAEVNYPKLFQPIFKNFTQPTVIQGQSWPIVFSGKDYVGLAATGSGKTLAFLLPALMEIIKVPKRGYGCPPLALVMAPTRELAQQIEAVLKDAIHGTGIRHGCIYGGAEKYRQNSILRSGVDIIIGTPGRLNDLLRDFQLASIKYLVLDEADRMLDMGFMPQITTLIDRMPADRQTLMFSATWPKEVKQLSERFLKDPVKVTVGNQELAGNINVTQHIISTDDCPSADARDELIGNKIMELASSKDDLIIVFCNEKHTCDQLQHFLRLVKNQDSIVLHGGKEQREREYGLRQFKLKRPNILIATDVAARGLDIPQVKAVVNHGFPHSIEDYVHRIGRTGRAGNKGEAYSYINKQTQNLRELVKILERTKQEIPPFLVQFQRTSMEAKSRYGFGGGRGGRGFGGRGGGRGFGGGRGGGRSNFGNNNNNNREGGFNLGGPKRETIGGGRGGRNFGKSSW